MKLFGICEEVPFSELAILNQRQELNQPLNVELNDCIHWNIYEGFLYVCFLTMTTFHFGNQHLGLISCHFTQK